jgi:phage portal protein BeeE
MVAGVGDDSLRPANPYKHWPEPHFKRILNKTKRKSPGKTLQSREFQRVPKYEDMSGEWLLLENGLHLRTQTIEATPHVGHAGRKPDPRPGAKFDH